MRYALVWIWLLVGVASAKDVDPVEREAGALAALHTQGKWERAAARVSANPRVHIWNSQRVAAVTAVFHSRARGMTVTARRAPGVKGTQALVFSPGVWARPAPRARRSDWPQDVLFLRAPVLVLRAGQQHAKMRVPVACASYRRHGPNPGRAYRLLQAKPGSTLARLARVLCAGQLPPTPELALAIWVGHERLGWGRFAGSSFRTFPTPRERILPRHAPGAYRLLERAGLRPAALPFFQAPDCQRLLPKKKAKPRPKPAKKKKKKPARPPADLS